MFKKGIILTLLAATLALACKETVAVTGVQLDKTQLTLSVGESAALNATVLPANATNKALLWSFKLEDQSIISIIESSDESCLVLGNGVGEAPVTATTAAGGYTATCTVTVTALESVTDLNFINKVGAQYAWQKEIDGTIKLTVANRQAVQAVTTLDLSSDLSTPDTEKLSDLSDSRRFTGLTALDCSYNKLTQLDISNNPALKSLSCGNNWLTA